MLTLILGNDRLLPIEEGIRLENILCGIRRVVDMRSIFILPFLGLLAVPTLFAGIDLDVSIAIGTRIESHEHALEDGRGPPAWAPAHGHRAKAKYHYYPEHEVYRNASTGAWIYYRNGEWSVGMSLPSVIRIGSESRFVSLEMNSDRPHAYHQEIVRSYPSTMVRVSFSRSSSTSSSHHPGKGHGRSKGNSGKSKGKRK